MDGIDAKIIAILRENSRANFVDIAKKLNVTEGTIRNRVAKLTNEKTITRFTIETSSNGASAFVQIQTNAKADTYKTCELISKIQGVERIWELAGEYDAMCKINASDLNHLNSIVENLRKTKGVTLTKTLAILKNH